MLIDAMRAELVMTVHRMGPMNWLGHLAGIGLLAILVPLRQGIDFLDVMFLLAYALLPCLFASPSVADSVASHRPQPLSEGYLAQVLTPFLMGIAWNLLILTIAFTVVNVNAQAPRLLLPHSRFLLHAGIFSLAATFGACAATGWIALNSKTAAAAKNQSRRLFLLILVGVVMWVRLGPADTKANLELRLTPQSIHTITLPVSLGLAALGYAFLRAGRKRRLEDLEGPVFKL
ncbi:MAG: hypothetical protein JNL98_25705 [Bryobacterales bacterium]|nr:hypothetical protein [Bryobacterales bacterium]